MEDAAWRSFREVSVAKCEACEAKERSRVIENETVAFKLATAAANQHADSQLNHLIKGSCGNARTFAQLILTDMDSSKQVIEWARCIDQELSTSIEWAHRRQVLVSLSGGTYMSQRTVCDLRPFLEQKLTGDGTVHRCARQAI